jgi:hypothetical protein
VTMSGIDRWFNVVKLAVRSLSQHQIMPVYYLFDLYIVVSSCCT